MDYSQLQNLQHHQQFSSQAHQFPTQYNSQQTAQQHQSHINQQIQNQYSPQEVSIQQSQLFTTQQQQPQQISLSQLNPNQPSQQPTTQMQQPIIDPQTSILQQQCVAQKQQCATSTNQSIPQQKTIDTNPQNSYKTTNSSPSHQQRTGEKQIKTKPRRPTRSGNERIPKLSVTGIEHGTVINCHMENKQKTITFKFDIRDVNPVDVAGKLVR